MSNYESKRSVRQKGFTLIEMSIVLVIIGLIIGGILKGQELIESSRQKNFISQVDGYRSALTTFSERYRALPGDFNCAWTAGTCTVGKISAAQGQLVNGNGDGIIAEANGPSANVAAMITFNGDVASNEELQFWVHLNMANLIGGISPLNVAPTGFGENNVIPATSFPSSGLSMLYGNYDSVTPKQTHWLKLHRTAGAAGTPALSPKQMAAIDGKMDDGTPGAGTFRTDGANAACGLITGTTATYVPTNENILCMAFIELIQ